MSQWLIIYAIVFIAAICLLIDLAPKVLLRKFINRTNGILPDKIRIWLAKKLNCNCDH